MKTKILIQKKALLILNFLLYSSVALCQVSDKSKSISHTIAYGSKGICLTNTEDTSEVRLTNGDHGYPAWSPDGKKLAFYSYHDEKKNMVYSYHK